MSYSAAAPAGARSRELGCDGPSAGRRRGSHGATLSPSSAVIGPDGRCCPTCRELVKRRWVWNREKGNVQKHRPRATLPRPSPTSRAVTSEPCCRNIKTGCQAATNKNSKSLLKCVCLFLKWQQEEGGSFGWRTCY